MGTEKQSGQSSSLGFTRPWGQCRAAHKDTKELQLNKTSSATAEWHDAHTEPVWTRQHLLNKLD